MAEEGDLFCSGVAVLARSNQIYSHSDGEIDMEEGVWQLLVRAVIFLSNQSVFLKSPQNQLNGGVSPNAHAKDADSTSTSNPVISPALLQIKRNPNWTTKDALFGTAVFGSDFKCFTMENRVLAVPEGTYSLEITYSPHFGKEMPLLGGTSPRTDIRIHPANWPTQLEGCVAVGQSIDGDSLSNSELAFEPLFAIIKNGVINGGISVQIINGV